MRYRLNVPSSLDFSALALDSVQNPGEITYLSEALEAVCVASGLSFEEIDADQDACLQVIAAWYQKHLDAGGARHPSADEILECLKRSSVSGFGGA